MQKEFNKLPNISNMLLSAFLIFNIIYLPLSLPISKFRYVEMNRQTQEGKQQVVGTHLLTHIEHPYVPYVCRCQRSWISRTKLKDNFLISLCIFSVVVLSSPSHILSLAFYKTWVPLWEQPWFLSIFSDLEWPLPPRNHLNPFSPQPWMLRGHAILRGGPHSGSTQSIPCISLPLISPEFLVPIT